MTPVTRLAASLRTTLGCVLLVGLFSSALGCGGGGDHATSAVPWHVSRVLGPRQVRLVASVEACHLHPTPAIQRPVIEYSGKKVFIELRVASQEHSEDEGCLLLKLGVYRTVTLKRNLDDLLLFDASTDPPERRRPN